MDELPDQDSLMREERRRGVDVPSVNAGAFDTRQAEPSPISPQDDSDHGYFSPGHETEAEPEPGLRGVPVRCELCLKSYPTPRIDFFLTRV